MDGIEHESVVVRRGPRSGATVVVALHSTVRGPALGGCRLWRYRGWREALEDAVALAAGMTAKAAVAGLPFGGGKAVVALPPGGPGSPAQRREVLLDVGDVVASLHGRYLTGPDVGSGPADMAVIAERTEHVLCTPDGAGDSSPATAAGTLACLEQTVAHLDGRDGAADLSGRAVTVIGLGHVGTHLVGGLVAAGARVSVTDTDPGRRDTALGLGARWIEPAGALAAPADVLVPAALGAGLDLAAVGTLRCTAIVGPANSQLAGDTDTAGDDAVADALHERGILWAPDYLVGAGGIVHATAVDLDRADPDEAARRVRTLGATWRALADQARSEGVPPHRVVRRLVRERLAEADASPASGPVRSAPTWSAAGSRRDTGTTCDTDDGAVERSVRRTYDRVAEPYTAATVDELAGKPLDRALIDAVATMCRTRGSTATTGTATTGTATTGTATTGTATTGTATTGAAPVLDAGCGPGHALRHMHAEGLAVYGVDLSPEMARIARRTCPAADVRVGSLLDLPYPDGTFAGALALYSIIHLAPGRVGAALAELRRVLVPGGVLLLAFHTGDRAVHLEEWFGHPVDLVGYLFDPEQVTAALVAAGFVVEARVDRVPYPDIELDTGRTSLIARRPRR